VSGPKRPGRPPRQGREAPPGRRPTGAPPPRPDPGAAGPGGLLSDPDLLSGRLFFAVPVPGPSREPLEAALPALGQALPAARWTSPGGWHLTLAFLGHVRPEFSAEVVAVGEQAVAGLGPARLRLDGAGAFPGQRRARVVWAGVSGDVEVLSAMATRLADASRRAGLRHEEREQQPHLTLARLPSPSPLPEQVLDLVTAAVAASPPWEARELCCYRSTLTNRGARYQVVRTFPLTRAG
jgi:RNA 2',3'-cyclic 3'-phosphodiesterase